ncbi:MAG: FAD-binding protein [Acidobacteria bacterium]|nr:MAG: FAD-binding protein [Acidobacteriota bacterium]
MSQPDPSTGFAVTTPAFLSRLAEIVGEDGLLTDDVALDGYGRDETEDLHFQPEAVVLPRDTEQVSRVLAWANENLVPVTPRGAGTGLSGGALPVHRGLVLSLERLDRIRSIDSENLTVVAEAGVVTAELQRRVDEHGLFYPPDPASRETCQLGGNIAEDSAGPRCCLYGSTRRWVMGLEAVRPDGAILETGSRNLKDVAGYNLTQLLVGSEGTLAVVTAATLRLIPRPAATLTLALPFDRLEQAARAVCEIFRGGHSPAACELLESGAIQAVAASHPVPAQLNRCDALILIELHGDDTEQLLRRAAALGETAEQMGGDEVLLAKEPPEQRRLWEIREKVGEAVKQRSLYKEADAVVPRSALAELVRHARRAAARHRLEAICYGHAGDGNLHVSLVQGELDAEAWQEARDAAEEDLFRAVVSLGGTVSGEHGIGWTQRRYLPLAVGETELETMAAIKRLFDPRGILNPGKIFVE